jgi:hypothetical protein
MADKSAKVKQEFVAKEVKKAAPKYHTKTAKVPKKVVA